MRVVWHCPKKKRRERRRKTSSLSSSSSSSFNQRQILCVPSQSMHGNGKMDFPLFCRMQIQSPSGGGKKIPFSFFQHFSGVIYRGSVHKSHGRIKRAVVSSSVLLRILSPIFGRGSPIYGNPILLSPEIKRGRFLKGQFINIIRIILIHMPIKGLILRVRFSPFSLRFLAT